jgi:hypothetical protein
MRNSKGQFVKVTKTVLRPGTRGKNRRGLSLNRKYTYTKKPKDFYLSGQPRSL